MTKAGILNWRIDEMIYSEAQILYCSGKLFPLIDRFFENSDQILNGNEDIEFLHKARVSARRIRSIVPLLEGYLSSKDVKRYRKRFRNIGRMLGDARDLDVRISFLDSFSEIRDTDGVKILRSSFVDKRNDLIDGIEISLRDFLGSFKIISFRENIQFLAHREVPPLDRSFYLSASSYISESYERVMDISRDIGIYERDTFHRLRKDCKRLRYILEVYDESFDGDLLSTIKELKSLQDLLGEMRDYDVWIEDIPLFIKDHGEPLGLSLLMEKIKDLLHERKADFPSLWRGFCEVHLRDLLPELICRCERE